MCRVEGFGVWWMVFAGKEGIQLTGTVWMTRAIRSLRESISTGFAPARRLPLKGWFF
jgi:hypothetical protein